MKSLENKDSKYTILLFNTDENYVNVRINTGDWKDSTIKVFNLHKIEEKLKYSHQLTEIPVDLSDRIVDNEIVEEYKDSYFEIVTEIVTELIKWFIDPYEIEFERKNRDSNT